jgi:hypothetical protein
MYGNEILYDIKFNPSRVVTVIVALPLDVTGAIGIQSLRLL